MLRDLVKKHFNLVDAPAEVEETKVEMSEEVVSEQIFGEIKTADGELTLTYEGEELAVGLPIFVVTEDGNVAAPDGDHALEGGVSIQTEAGLIVEIAETESEISEEEIEEEVASSEEDMSTEEMSEEVSEEEMSEETTEEEMSEESSEEVEEEFEEKSEKEAIIEALAEVLTPMLEEMKSEIEEMKSKFSETEKKVETFASAPAAERTKAEITNRNYSKKNVDFTPLNDDKAKQFERLLKIRNKK